MKLTFYLNLIFFSGSLLLGLLFVPSPSSAKPLSEDQTTICLRPKSENKCFPFQNTSLQETPALEMQHTERLSDKQLIQRVLKIAKHYVGAREFSRMRVGKPSILFSNGRREPWCSNFAKSVMMEAGLRIPGNWRWLAGTPFLYDMMKTLVPFRRRWKYRPQIGDIAIYDRPHTPGKPSHIGFVIHVTDSKVFTVEGNYQHQVQIPVWGYLHSTGSPPGTKSQHRIIGYFHWISARVAMQIPQKQWKFWLQTRSQAVISMRNFRSFPKTFKQKSQKLSVTNWHKQKVIKSRFNKKRSIIAKHFSQKKNLHNRIFKKVYQVQKKTCKRGLIKRAFKIRKQKKHRGRKSRKLLVSSKIRYRKYKRICNITLAQISRKYKQRIAWYKNIHQKSYNRLFTSFQKQKNFVSSQYWKEKRNLAFQYKNSRSRAIQSYTISRESFTNLNRKSAMWVDLQRMFLVETN